MRTPWGDADYEKKYAEGITFYSTPSHGGFKLSPERIAEIPKPLRGLGGYTESWYEEDCAWAAVAFTFPEVFVTETTEGWATTIEEAKEKARLTLERWYPEELRAATAQQTLPVG